MKILHLTLKKKWFDMILSGEKKEEYREIKDHWVTRIEGKSYDAIKFVNGYGKSRPSFMIELKSIKRGSGIPWWGGKFGEIQYVLELGKIL